MFDGSIAPLADLSRRQTVLIDTGRLFAGHGRFAPGSIPRPQGQSNRQISDTQKKLRERRARSA